MGGFDYSSFIERVLSKNRWDTERELAQQLGVSTGTWTAYKRGDRSWGLHEIAKICDTLQVDARWLLFGDADATSRLGEAVLQLVTTIHAEAGIRLPTDRALQEAQRLTEEVMSELTDENDREEIDMRLKLLEKKLRKQVKTASSLPGTGKRLA